MSVERFGGFTKFTVAVRHEMALLYASAVLAMVSVVIVVSDLVVGRVAGGGMASRRGELLALGLCAVVATTGGAAALPGAGGAGGGGGGSPSDCARWGRRPARCGAEGCDRSPVTTWRGRGRPPPNSGRPRSRSRIAAAASTSC